MEHLFDYLLFLAETVTLVAAILIVLAGGLAIGMRRAQGARARGHLDVREVNQQLTDMRQTLRHALLDPQRARKADRRERRADKKRSKTAPADRARLFVMTFDGDIQASRVEALRNEITAVLTSAGENDEVVVRLDSAGGTVPSYGLAASQLSRVRSKGVKLTVAVDKMAASGGYLMASVADRILAAPFAVVGSIGVVAQVPNVHRLLKNHDVDVEVLTAGKYKRTLTVLGENTEEGRRKFIEELEDVHTLFQEYVAEYRPAIDLEQVSTGEVWYGRRAVDQRLVDEIMTSDEYLMERCEEADVFEVSWTEHKKPLERIMSQVGLVLDRISAWIPLSLTNRRGG